MEAFIFTVANEDYNCYSFDMRKLTDPTMVHMDHVSAGKECPDDLMCCVQTEQKALCCFCGIGDVSIST